jgi:3-hydroxyacyl-CoA dehydrogenase/3a,7a,12a-trihydroxy-5b-cholest-24-enoyl-CoA hydratase
MTATVMSEEVVNALKPDYVVPLVAYLVHESCKENGSIFEVAAGYISKLRFHRSKGKAFLYSDYTAENVKNSWEEIVNFEGNTPSLDSQAGMEHIMNNIERNSKAKAASAASTGGDSGLKSEAVFKMMEIYLSLGEGKKVVPKVQATFNFNILTKKGGPIVGSWAIDLKNGNGKSYKGKIEKADSTFTMTDDDFFSVCMGTLNPQMAFMQGKMKIAGNMAKATKFTPDLFPPPTPENLNKYAAKL